MLETAYIVAKILMSVVFVLLSLFLLVFTSIAYRIKEELIRIEEQIRTELRTAYNIGAAVVTLILTIAFSGPGVKAPIWLSVLSYSGLAKYKDLYKPLNSIWNSTKEISSRILSFKK